MKPCIRFPALAAAVLLAALFFGGCLKIRPISAPADPGISDPTPAAPSETDPTETEPTETEPPETEPAETLPPEEITIDEELLANAVALGIAGNDEHYIEEPEGLWNVIGWYAALTARVKDAEPWLSDGTAEALEAILRPDEDPVPIPEGWLSGGISRETRDGRPGILFSEYETLLGETLGIWRELSQTEEDGTRIVTVTDHPEGGTETFFVYVAIAEDPNDNQRKMVYLVMTDPIRMPVLTFTLADVRERNRISKLLAAYSCVTVDMSDEFGTAYQAFWLRDGERVYYEIDETDWEDAEGNPVVYRSEFGNYRGVSFNTNLTAEPTVYLRITAKPADRADEEYYENYLTKYLPADEDVIGELTPLGETADDVTFSVLENYVTESGSSFEIRHICTVKKDTLAICDCREDYVTPDGSPSGGGFTVSYNGEKLGEDAMKAWDSLRTVTLDIKTEAGERTETETVPEGWYLQLIADEGITVYADEALTELTYNYVGSDTGDITLYARDEANALPAGIDASSVLQNMIAANRITALTEKYGQVMVNRAYKDGTVTNKQEFFRSGDTFVVHETLKNPYLTEPRQSGIIGNDPRNELWYEIGSDGRIHARLRIDITRLDEAGGEAPYFRFDDYLVDNIGGSEPEIVGETDGTVTFSVPPAEYFGGDGPPRYVYTVDRESFTILNLETPDELLEVVCGEDAAPFSAVYAEAAKDCRTVTCHHLTAGETEDIVWRIPSAWDVNLSVIVYADGVSPSCYADAGLTQPADSVIPAYSGDVELWVTAAVG